jgi:hypothetical protein
MTVSRTQKVPHRKTKPGPEPDAKGDALQGNADGHADAHPDSNPGPDACPASGLQLSGRHGPMTSARATTKSNAAHVGGNHQTTRVGTALGW